MTHKISSLTEAALAVARLGFPVFPCDRNKQPACKHGFHDASLDPEVIVRLFQASDGAVLIGVPMGSASGIVALDIDMKDDGPAWLAEHEGDLPATRVHRSPSGGRHYFFRLPEEEIRNSQSRIAKGVDTRGEGGYVCWPTPGWGYAVESDADFADMPEWLIEAQRKPPPPPPAPLTVSRREHGGTAYGLAALADECQKINRAGFGEQERTLNEAALRMGHLVAGGQLEEGLALADLMSAGYSMPSQPGREPWRPDDIQKKVRRAFEQGLADPRIPKDKPRTPSYSSVTTPFSAPEESNDMFADAMTDIRKAAASVREELALRRHVSAVRMSKTSNDFVEGLIEAQTSVLLYGPSNVGKSFLALDLAMHVATGISWRGREVDHGTVLYVNREGNNALGKRLAAWEDAHGERAGSRFRACYIYDQAVDLVHGTQGADAIIEEALGAASDCGFPLRMIVIDTASKVMAGADENSSVDMTAFIANIDRIKEQTGATVLLVHHSGKDADKGARGHSSLRAAVDSEIAVSMLDDESKIRVAKVLKQRDLEVGDRFEFSLRVHNLGETDRGREITSCTIEHVRSTSDFDTEVKGQTRRAMKVLVDLIAERGTTHNFAAPGGAASVPDTWWRERFMDRCMPAASSDEKKRAFRRASDALVNMSRVAMSEGRVWLVRAADEQRSSEEGAWHGNARS